MSRDVIYYANMPLEGKETPQEKRAMFSYDPAGMISKALFPGKLYRVTVKSLCLCLPPERGERPYQHKGVRYVYHKDMLLYLGHEFLVYDVPEAYRPYVFARHVLKFLGPDDKVWAYFFSPGEEKKIVHYFIEHSCYTFAKEQKKKERKAARVKGAQYQEILEARGRGETWAQPKSERLAEIRRLRKLIEDAQVCYNKIAVPGVGVLEPNASKAYSHFLDARENLEKYKKNIRLKKP